LLLYQYNDSFASISAKTLGKRIGKVTTEAQEKSGI
jgi:hypothetical protein